MATNGFYENSGDWMYEVGMPGKSGVSGGIVTIAPGKGSMPTFSPRLNAAGNSVRGSAATVYLSRALGMNVFASAAAGGDRPTSGGNPLDGVEPTESHPSRKKPSPVSSTSSLTS